MKGLVKTTIESGNTELKIGLLGEIWTIGGNPTEGKDIIEEICSGFMKNGIKLFDSLDGQFTLSIEDRKNRQFYLVRDKIGVIPVYYSPKNGMLAWGNRITDITSQEGFAAVVNSELIHCYLVFRYVCGKHTLYKDVFEILHGHFLSFDMQTGAFKITRYWEIPFEHYDTILKTTETEIIDNLEEIMIRRIKRNLSYRDLHYGILSSGGVDSSLIVAMASRHVGGCYETFYIGFPDYEGDRSKDAQMVGDFYGTSHKDFYVDTKQFADGLIDTIRAKEEPINHPGNVGLIQFLSHIQGSIDAFLLGDGIDTFFCSSKTYALLKYGYRYNPLRTVTEMLFTAISPDIMPSQLRRYYSKIRDAMITDPQDYLVHSFTEAGMDEANEILTEKNDLKYLDFFYGSIAATNRKNVLRNLLALNEMSFMVEGLNAGAMFFSNFGMRNYYPFVDVELIDLANRIPFNLKSRLFTGKYIIKRLAERYFPKSFIYKRKEGFGVPMKSFFMDKKGLGRYFDILTDSRTLNRGIWDRNTLLKLYDTHRTGKMPQGSYESLLWTVLNLELWFRIFIDISI
jgi:asparagine synthase (glutamine-hydrolysing)